MSWLDVVSLVGSLSSVIGLILALIALFKKR